jgi:hypothetical protein
MPPRDPARPRRGRRRTLVVGEDLVAEHRRCMVGRRRLAAVLGRVRRGPAADLAGQLQASADQVDRADGVADQAMARRPDQHPPTTG